MAQRCDYCGGGKSFHHKDGCLCHEDCDCMGFTKVRNDTEYKDDEE